MASAIAQPPVGFFFQQSRRADDAYRQGTRALDDRNYDRATREFDRVIEAKSSRADGAYYWKAYALNKQGKRDEALAALAEIPKQFPQSRWINDAKALEAEVRQATGQSVSPENQSDEDLKLFAINALVNSEPDRAIPLLEKVLNEPKNSPNLKRRALYVLAQSRSEKAREIVGQYARNGSNPDLQLRAIEYLGVFRASDSRQILADIYASSSDMNVKRAVLQGFMVSQAREQLLNVAKAESNADLKREAIILLGSMRAENELAQLYTAETSRDLKMAIIQGMRAGNSAGKLVEIARTEKDPELKREVVRMLSTMKSKEATDYLVELLSK